MMLAGALVVGGLCAVTWLFVRLAIVVWPPKSNRYRKDVLPPPSCDCLRTRRLAEPN